jgi:PAS domain S-box-containing protein
VRADSPARIRNQEIGDAQTAPTRGGITSSDPRRRKYHAWIAFTYAGSLTLLFLFAVASFFLQSSIRAYVTGEGFWSKAQKDAVAHLVRYGGSGDEADYQRYLHAIAIPLADHEARLALEQTNGRPITCRDFGNACEAFVRAQNHPDDVVWMARLFYYLSEVGYIHHAIEVWARADDSVLRLQSLAEGLHREMIASNRDPALIRASLRRIAEVYDGLTPLEDEFSRTLGAGARQALVLNTSVLAVATAVLIMIGLWFSRRMLRSLQRADQRYRHYLDAAGDAIVITDRATGQIVEVNQMAVELSGYPRQSLMAMRAAELFGVTDGTNPLVWDGSSISTEVVLRNAHGQGVLVDVRSRTTTIHDEEVILTILRDVTEQRQFEKRSAEAARMEMVGRLAGGIAHDFNNLLAGIMIYASDVHAEAPTGRLRQAFDEILKCSHSGAELVEHLLAFSRKQKMVQREFELNDVIMRLAPLLKRLLGERIQLTAELEQREACIVADPAGIEQVITNLITNARDAMPRGGEVTIRTRRLGAEEIREIRPSAHVEGDAILLSVQDTGEGMDEDTRARVFDPFFTTKPDGKGTGLGLSSVYGAVRQSSGEIWLSSALGQGTVVQVLFPAVRTLSRLATAGNPR